MELRERILIGKHYFGSGCEPVKGYSINDQPYQTLLKNLHEEGVAISEEHSQKTIEYRLPEIEGEATVPLETEFPKYSEAQVTSYILRDGKSLELKLKDYEDITSRPAPGIIGGSIGGNFGIIGHLKIKGEKINQEIVEKVRNALEKTYDEDKNRIIENLKKLKLKEYK